MTHDPMCKEAQHYECHGEDWTYWCMDNPECDSIECNCQDIAEIRKSEREWVTSSAAKEILNHEISDGVCACGMNAPNPLEHIAWIVEVYINHDLLPKHEVTQ